MVIKSFEPVDDYIWDECPICGKAKWCRYYCDRVSELMAVYLCCDECVGRKEAKQCRKMS